MTKLTRFGIGAARRSLLRDQRGVAAVEFALISAVMFGLLSGGVDLTRAVIAERDLSRFTAEVAQVLAACDGEGCVMKTISDINLRIANVAPGLGNLQWHAAVISRKNDMVKIHIGTLYGLDAKMNARAMTALENGDYGVAVSATSSIQPIILGFAQKWGFTIKNFQRFTIALQSRGSA